MKPSDHHEERDYSSQEVRNLRATLNASTVAHAQAVEDLRQSEARFRMLVHGIQDYAIFILDLEGNVQSWNEGAHRLKGYHEEEIIGKHFSTFYTPEDVASHVPQQLLRIAAQEGRVEQEGWRVRKDGTRFWADVVITALRDKDGRAVGFGKVTRDLTEQKRAEDALRQSEERFRRMIESVQDYAIFMLDPSGHVMSWNPGAQRFKGYREEEIIGKHFSVFYMPEDAALQVPARLLRLAAQEGHAEHEGWRVRKDGTRFWADVVITAMRRQDGELLGFVKVVRDLTERRRADEERIHLAQERVARQAAEESVRVRDEFLGVAAHELKTPVTSLLLQIQLLARRLTKTGTLDPGTVHRALALVTEQSQKLSLLVTQLLDVSRVANGHLAIEPTTANVVPLVASVVERLSMLSPERQFDFAAPEVVFASVDPLRLEQVVTNLIENALKYSPTGPIEVSVSRLNAAQVQIAVRDHGPGVPESQREHLFDRFYQVDTRNYQSGMGLGLYISKQIALLHGGDLTAVFPDEGGSRFVVTLPTRQPE